MVETEVNMSDQNGYDIKKTHSQKLMSKLSGLILSGGGANRQPSRSQGQGKTKGRKQKRTMVYEQVSTRGIFNNLSRQPRVQREFKKNGTLVITNEEPFLTVTGNGQEAVFNPGQTGMVMLDNTSAQYDQYKIRSCSLEYRTGTGTTVSGNLVMGVDYNPQSDVPSDNSYAAVAILEPKFVGPVWTACSSIPLEVSRAMKGNTWRFTNNTGPSGSAFVLRSNVNTTGQTYGIIWCKYSVEFCSPKQISNVGPTVSVPTSRVTGEILRFADESAQSVAVVNAANTTTGFAPIADVFGQGNINTAGNNSFEVDLVMPSCPSGTITTVNVGVPSYAYQASLNAQPQLIVLSSTGSDITALFKVTPQGLSQGPLNPLGDVSGIWAWALTALVPIAQEYGVKIVTKLFDGVLQGLTSYFVEGTASQSVVPLEPDTSRISTLDGLGQAVILVPGTATSTFVISNGIKGMTATATHDTANLKTLFNFHLDDPAGDLIGRLVCVNVVSTTPSASTPTTELVADPVNLTTFVLPTGSPASLHMAQMTGGFDFGFSVKNPSSGTYVQSVVVTVTGMIAN